MNTNKQVLDPCCGSKLFYFQKEHQLVLFGDIRDETYTLDDGRAFEVRPDLVLDYRNLPFGNESFYLVIFDPPHLKTEGKWSWLYKTYGKLDKDTWPDDLKLGFDECWRVLKPGGTMIFKWNEAQIKVNRVLECFSQEPLTGSRISRNLKTHWYVFYKPVEVKCED